MMYYVTLRKIESSHNKLRTDEVEGLAPELPESGKRFFMYADALELDEVDAKRYVHTSVVQKVVKRGDDLVFHTENSTYCLTDITKASGEENV